jgi:hypothetical protein
MENKYYTPTIEEFHVGFEYEELNFIYTDKGWYTDKREGWVKKEYQCANYLEMYYLQKKLELDIFKEVIRVKYLDREDIESLGFHYSDNSYYWLTENTKGNELDLELIFNYEEHYIQILNWAGSYSFTLFEGYIKNKSELKQVLKMLQINE